MIDIEENHIEASGDTLQICDFKTLVKKNS